jgi:hypothetical protein
MNLAVIRWVRRACVPACLATLSIAGSANAASAGVEFSYGKQQALPRLDGTATIATDAAGDLFEVADGQVVRFPAGASSGAGAQMVPGLTDAFALTAAPDGSVLISSLGPGNQPLLSERLPDGSVVSVQVQPDPYALATDRDGDAYWIGYGGIENDIGGITELTFAGDQFEQSPLTIPVVYPRGLTALAVSPGGDVYEVSMLDEARGLVYPVEEVAAGATSAVTVPFADEITSLAVDPWGDVYGITAGGKGAVMLPAGGCQADQVQLPFSRLRAALAIAVDGHGDVFVADGSNVLRLPATGRRPVPACPLRLSGLTYRHLTAHRRPTLSFGLVAARKIEQLRVELPRGMEFAGRTAAVRRGLTVREAGIRSLAYAVRIAKGQLVITLRMPARRVSVTTGTGVIRYGCSQRNCVSGPDDSLFGAPTYISASSTSGHTIGLMWQTPHPLGVPF